MLTRSNLNELNSYLKSKCDYYDVINYGGCLVAAVILVKALQAKGVKAHVRYNTGVFCCSGHRSASSIAKAVQSSKCARDYRKNKGPSIGHAMVEVEGMLWDTDELITSDHDNWVYATVTYHRFGRLNLKVAEWLANKPSLWNSRFNRKHIPHLTKHINRFVDTHNWK